MKPETKQHMEEIGFSLPFGWQSNFLNGEHAEYRYTPDTTGTYHSVSLDADGGLFVGVPDSFGNVCCWTIPKEVMFAMYRDRDVFAVWPHEGKALPDLINQRDTLVEANALKAALITMQERHIADLITMQGRQIADLRARLNEQTRLRKKHNATADNLRNEVKVLRAKVHKQRYEVSAAKAALDSMSRQLRAADLEELRRQKQTVGPFTDIQDVVYCAAQDEEHF